MELNYLNRLRHTVSIHFTRGLFLACAHFLFRALIWFVPSSSSVSFW